MAATHKTLKAFNEIEAYLHRLRMQMLRALADGPATSTQVAERLGVHPANLTRHWRVLLDAGLVVLAETRDTGRNLEKYYAATAGTFDVAPDVDALAVPHKIALSLARSEFSRAIAQLPDVNPGLVKVFVAVNLMTPTAQVEFAAALSELVSRFKKQKSPDGEPFALVLSLHPTAAPAKVEERIRLSKSRKAKR